MDSFNNVFVDLKQLQKAMVRFYGQKQNDCLGKLVFVIKMDEAQLVKEHKLEWVSICIMNKALQFAQGNEEVVQDFSVQSERDIWWLAALETPKECHETLKWVFQRAGIVEIIKR